MSFPRARKGLTGGPQKMQDPILSASIKPRKRAPFPRRCSCPTKSSRLDGRTISGSGFAASRKDLLVVVFTRGFFVPLASIEPSFVGVARGLSAVESFGSAMSRPRLLGVLVAPVSPDVDVDATPELRQPKSRWMLTTC